MLIQIKLISFISLLIDQSYIFDIKQKLLPDSKTDDGRLMALIARERPKNGQIISREQLQNLQILKAT